MAVSKPLQPLDHTTVIRNFMRRLWPSIPIYILLVLAFGFAWMVTTGKDTVVIVDNERMIFDSPINERTTEENIDLDANIAGFNKSELHDEASDVLRVSQTVGDFSRLISTTGKSGNLKHVTSLTSRLRCPQKVNVLVIVSSNARNVDRRMMIRQTWGRGLMNREWLTVFALANLPDENAIKRAVTNEKLLYNDLIQGNFDEGFYNLSEKVRVEYEWAALYCKFNYLIKADDDVYINMPQMLAFLRSDDVPQEGLYAGNVQYAAYVQRGGKYGVSKSEYKGRIYPRYCSGGGFVMSTDAVSAVFKSMTKMRNPLKIDDAYIGEAALKAGIDVYHSNLFDMFRRKCEYDSNTLVYHPSDLECMSRLHTKNMNETLYTKHIKVN